ncbi:uncharacterized protein LOC143377577 isoform X2 [Andrena cerasifolii]
MVSAKVNKLFDTILPSIRNLLLKFGLDPMKMKNIVQPLEGIIDKDGTLEMKDGWLQGMSDVARAGDIVLAYSNKILNIDMDLGFDVLDINYEYFFKYGLIKRTGDFHGRFSRVKLRVALTLDMTTKKTTLDSLRIVDMGKLDVKLEGHILDSLLNVAIKAFTTIFRQCVMEFIEERFTVVFKGLLKDLNEMIQHLGDPDKQIPMLSQLNMIQMLNELNLIPILDQLDNTPMLKKLNKIHISDELQGIYDSTLNDAEITFEFYAV